MSELYNIINEFDVRMTDNKEDDTENTGLDFEKEFGPDRHGKSMKGDDVNGRDDIEGLDSPENGEMSFDGDSDDGEDFGMNYGDGEDRGPEGMSYDDEGSEDDDMFAGEKRTDITHKLKQMLQNRGMYKDLEGGEDDEEGGEELPDLDDLDLDLSADSDYEEDDEDPDFDYSAFSDERDSESEPESEEDDEDVEFNFDLENR